MRTIFVRSRYVTWNATSKFAGLLALALFLGLGCRKAEETNEGGASPANDVNRPTIAATPNPVPAGAGRGTTSVKWNAGDVRMAQIFVSIDGAPEVLFAGGGSGTQDAPWIDKGSTYVFRMYSGTDHKKLIGSVQVTRN